METDRYALGVDLGTTYTAAAVWRPESLNIVGLGNRAAAIPSVVFLREDEEILTGEAADRRAATEPGRVAREFKRRVGDPTPILLGGTPYSAEALSAKLLRWVVARVAELEGGPPGRIAVTHPANWGPYKQDLLSQAVRMADLGEVSHLAEPEAAAIYYASQSRVEVGAMIAVYDLGGGTFDAAVLRKTSDGFELLGEPEGIERLGGIDFDEAVFAHVADALGGALDELDPDDPATLSAVARLRLECVEAKEALSSDTEVSIPVLLPNRHTEVRLTRPEFEAMVRPALAETMGALRRALGSADAEPEDIDTVLLVGGSSRIPLVAQLVGAELRRPVAVDAHPKHSVALGAALAAAADLSGAVPSSAPGAEAEEPVGTGEGGSFAAAAAAAAGAGGDTSEPDTHDEDIGPAPDSGDTPPADAPPVSDDGAAEGEAPPAADRRRLSRRVLAISGALVLFVAVVIGFVFAGGDGDPASTVTSSPATTERSTTGDSVAAFEDVHINFQARDASTPDGWLVDYGQPYGEQDNGHTYGWVVPGSGTPMDMTAHARDRDLVDNQLVDTLMHFRNLNPASDEVDFGAWELAVPNGSYLVTVSVGEAEVRNQKNTVIAENVPVITDFVNAESDMLNEENTVTVDVDDGRLTLESTEQSTTKINYVEAQSLD